jgi:hypothetical protein
VESWADGALSFLAGCAGVEVIEELGRCPLVIGLGVPEAFSAMFEREGFV